MAYYSTTAATQPQTDQDLSALTIGFAKVFVDGSFVGSLKESSKVNLNWNPMDKLIVTAQYPGTALGKRQLGESPTITFEAIETVFAHIKKYLDMSGTVGVDTLQLGKRNNVATYHTLDIYGEGPGQRTRRWSFYRVSLEIDGEVNIADPEDFTTFRVIARAFPNMSLPTTNWFGEIHDSPAS